jgi:predicted dehydrogenase
METIGVGIIGTGAVAQVAHLPALTKMKDISIEALCDVDLARASEVAVRFGVPRVFRDYRSMLDLDEIHAILICLPTYLNLPVSIAALEAGKHVLCEKPLSKSSQEAKMMVRAAEKFKRFLVPAYNFRYRPEGIMIKEMLKDNQLGEIWHFDCGWLRTPEESNVSPWKMDYNQSGGGVLMDLGTHLLDLVFWLIDSRPIWVSGNVKYKTEKSFIDYFASADIVLEKGKSFHIATSWAYYTEMDNIFLNIHLSNGLINFPPLKVQSYSENRIKNISQPLDSPRNTYKLSYRNELRNFFDIIRGLYPAQQSCLEDWEINRLVELIYQSSWEKQPIKF